MQKNTIQISGMPRSTLRGAIGKVGNVGKAGKAGKEAGVGRYGLAGLVLALALSACGDAKKEPAASQTAVRVNKEELTVHQINLLLQQQRGLKPEQVDLASRRIVEFLIDQELAVQRSKELKLDQDGRVLLQLEAAKREVLSRAYAEKLGESVAKPSPEEVKKYYDDKPALFKERRVYSLQELTVEATPAQLVALKETLAQAKTMNDVVQHLRSNNLRFTGDQGVRAAEQLPAPVLELLSKTKEGQMTWLPTPAGAVVTMHVNSRLDPIDETRATPVIELFLTNEAKRKRLDGDIKALRAAARIEYVGKFAPAASAASAASAAGAGATPAAAGAAATPPAAAASGLTADTISQGLGIKK